MDLITCPECGEKYSSSYASCPFCEEEGEDSRKIRYIPKRHIADKRKAQSARGGLIAVGVLVLALVGWYIFGGAPRDKAPKETSDETPQTQGEPAVPVSDVTPGPAPAGADAQPGTDEPGGENGPQPTDETPEPAVPDANVDVSGAKLNRDDFTLGYGGEKFTLRVSGTEAEPWQWSIDNPNVATINAEGTVTAVANGDTMARCKVGTRDLECKVRVRGTGKTAESAAEPMVATPATPTAPASPSSPETPSTPATVDAATLKVKTNYGTTLQKDPSSGYPDCTVYIGGDPIALHIVDEDGSTVTVSSWESDKTSVLTVSADGKLNPVSAGTAHVTATVGGVKITCIIRVHNK